MEINHYQFDTSLNELNNNYHINRTIYENLEEENKGIEKNEAVLKLEIDDLSTVKSLLETLKIYKLKEKKDFILSIINTALVDIFRDNIRLSIEPQEANKTSKASIQKFDIIFYQNEIELARNEELLITNGGGIMQVVSMLFKLLIGFIYSKNTFYMFDESFSQLSSDNRIRLSKFLKEFCEKYNFTIVVVSQVLDLDEHADIIYTVNASYNSNGIRTLILENTETKPGIDYRNVYSDEEGIWNLKIKNFQSIDQLSLTFKGYTVIRGPNNSGKSAILRAVSAILYNSFNVKKYPRKIGGLDTKGNPSKKVLPVEIELTKNHLINRDDTDGTEQWSSKSIGLKYKTSKLSFILEGEEYYGKNLASEKLKEKIEDLGFKYISTKEFYKNFKGNLKDQTERIASTNQYDSLFLVGSKGNETEKIFNFLFNTENITKAIQVIKEELIELGKRFDDQQKLKLDNVSKIDIQKNLMLLYYKKYYIFILENLSIFNLHDEKNIKDQKNIELNKVNELLNLLKTNKTLFEFDTKIISESIINLNYLNETLILKKNKLTEVNKNKEELENNLIKINGLKSKINFLNSIDLSENIFDEVMNTKKNKLIKINEIVINLTKVFKLSSSKKEMIGVNQELIKYKDHLEPKVHEINRLGLKYAHLFKECKACSSTGFLIKENNE